MRKSRLSTWTTGPSGIILIGLLAGCAGNTPERPVAVAACDTMPASERPAWVIETAGEPGYFVGKGSAGREATFGEQTRQAQMAALKALAQSIRVSVQSTQRADQRVSVVGGKEHVSRDYRDIMQVSTDLTLQSVEQGGQWLDRSSCTLHVRLRMSESSLRHQRLRGLLATARDQTLPIPERLEALEIAEAVLSKIDFRQVADSEGADFYRAQLHKERASLSAFNSDSVAIIQIARGLPPSLGQDVLGQLPFGGQFVLLERADCDKLEACVQVARWRGAQRLLYGRVTLTQTPAMLGGIAGKLNVELSLADVQTGKPIWGPKTSSEPMLTFEEFGEAEICAATQKAASANVFQPPTQCLSPSPETKTCL